MFVLASGFLIFLSNRFAMLHIIFYKQLRSRNSIGGQGKLLMNLSKFPF